MNSYKKNHSSKLIYYVIILTHQSFCLNYGFETNDCVPFDNITLSWMNYFNVMRTVGSSFIAANRTV